MKTTKKTKKTKKKKVTLVLLNDWEAIYVDGKVVDQGHSFPSWRLLDILAQECPDGFVYEDYEVTNEIIAHAENVGTLPESLVDVAGADW